MSNLEEILGIDPSDPEMMRAMALAEGDHQFLRALVELRRELGLTQQDVAEKLGIRQATVAAFERYDNDPKLSTIRRYAQVVGLLITHRVEVDIGQLRNQAGLDRSQDTPGSDPPARPELSARASPPGR
jgi:DNA-binding XRE family transcriptional regulator